MAPSRTDLLWDQGEDEAVEVNQRALIDSGLSRVYELSAYVLRNIGKVLWREH
jgi:hypothetical protein